MLPEPLPDELAGGLLRRLMVINGIDSPRELRALVKAGEHVPQAFSPLRFLATAYEFSLQDLLRRHTVVPVVFARPERKTWNSPLTSAPTQCGADCTAARWKQRLRACSRCMKRDALLYGHAYWHRQHQLFGITRCPQHGVRLFESDDGSTSMPDHPFPDPDRLKGTRLPVTEAPEDRLLQVQRWLLSSCKPISRTRLIVALAKRCKKARVGQLSARRSNQSLTELLHEQFGAAWLHLHFHGEPPTIMTYQMSYMHLLAVLTALFPTASAAVNCLARTRFTSRSLELLEASPEE